MQMYRVVPQTKIGNSDSSFVCVHLDDWNSVCFIMSHTSYNSHSVTHTRACVCRFYVSHVLMTWQVCVQWTVYDIDFESRVFSETNT